MILTYNEAYKKYKNDYGISKAISNKEIYKVARGIYSDKLNIDPIIIYSKKYPSAIVTMDSAFYYYKLTDYIPDKVYLSIARHARPIKDENVVISYIDDEVIDYGKIAVQIEGEEVQIYNKERLLVELIRKKNQVPFDYYKEIINNYRLIKDDLEMDKIEEYALMFRNYDKIFDVIQKEVF
jgi:predicted transcriptional regulator of viral defense system